jgi:hypothetical protein
VIWSDESSFTLFPASGRVYVWRRLKEAYNPEFLVPTVKYGCGPVMVWAAVSWYSILLVSLLPFMAELLQGSTWTCWVIRCIPWSEVASEQRCSFPRRQCPRSHSWNCSFSHGVKSMKVNFSISPRRHNNKISTSLNQSSQF